MKKVSLILTSYNCVENITRTLKSIEEQDYPNIEVIIKDGVSTDGTLDVIQKYAQESKYQVKWISDKDTGIFDAMNIGYAYATGDIIAFFNDLFLGNDVVTKMVCAIEDSGEQCMGVHADLVYATDEKVVRYWKMGQGKISQGWMPGHPTLYLKREVYEKYGLYDTKYRCSADFEFMVRILKDNKLQLAYIPEVLIRMYYGGTSTSSAGSYWLSIRESYDALKKNNVPFAVMLILKRTWKVMLQFIKQNTYDGISLSGEE